MITGCRYECEGLIISPYCMWSMQESWRGSSEADGTVTGEFVGVGFFYLFSAGLWGHLLLTWGEPCSGVLSKLRLPVAKTFGSLFAFSCRGLFFFWTWCSSCASTRLQKQSLLMQTFMFSDVTIFIICIRGYYSYSEVLTAGRSDPTLASYQTLHYGVTYIL